MLGMRALRLVMIRPVGYGRFAGAPGPVLQAGAWSRLPGGAGGLGGLQVPMRTYLPGRQLQVILTANVDGVGRRGQVVNVAPGYARNYLIRQELAVYSTPKTRKEMGITDEQVAASFDQAGKGDSAQRDLERIVLVFREFTPRRQANRGVSRFRNGGAIDQERIGRRLMERHGIFVPNQNILLPDGPISSIGEFKVPVQFLDLEDPVTIVVRVGKRESFHANRLSDSESEEGEKVALAPPAAPTEASPATSPQ